MHRTEFKIPKMDCSAEEHLIRAKLEPLEGVRGLRFDLPGRKLEIFHSGGIQAIRSNLEELKMGAVQVAHEENTAWAGDDSENPQEKSPLIAALSINATLFVAEMIVGILAYSLGLVADSLDMLADAIVYGMALAAVGGSALKKKSIARLTGYFQVFLACAGLVEVIRRSIGGEGTPDFRAMLILSFIALLGNSATLLILNKTRKAGAHMKAVWICTSVDVQANLLVILSAVAVYYTQSRFPDIAVGGFIFLIVANGARRILAIAK